jgi:hypothetical protein
METTPSPPLFDASRISPFGDNIKLSSPDKTPFFAWWFKGELWEIADKADCAGFYSIAFSYETKAFGCCGFDIDACSVYVQDRGEFFAHLIDIWREFRCFGENCRIYIYTAVITFMQGSYHAFEQDGAVDIFVLIITVGKPAADVTESGSTKQGVADRVDKHIGIRVACKAFVEWHRDTTEYQRSPVDKGVYINSVAYAIHGYQLLGRSFWLPAGVCW